MDFEVQVRRRNSQQSSSEPPAPLSAHASRAPGNPKSHKIRSSIYHFAALAIALVLCISSYLYLRNDFETPALSISAPSPVATKWTGFNTTLDPQAHRSRSPKTISYNWTITSAIRRPDGVAKRIYLINNQFPGPTLEGRPGDKFVIRVDNALKDEGISIHWHGLHMRNQNQYDGAVGITQCSIAPGAAYAYEISISSDQHGTFWYHAHDQVQRADGVYGAFVIHRPMEADVTDIIRYDYDEERLLLVGDWYHRSAEDVLKWYMRAGSFGNEPVPDSILLNGVGAYDCSLAVPARPVDCVVSAIDEVPELALDMTKRYRFRLINTGSLAGVTVGIDEAVLTPLTVDGGHPIQRHLARSIGVLHPGERVDFVASFVPQTQQSRTNIHVTLDDDSFKYPNAALSRSQPFAVRLMVPATTPLATHESAAETIDFLDIQGVSSSEDGELESVEITQNISIYTTTLKLSRLSNVPHGFMNHTTWKPQTSPALPLLAMSRSEWDSNQFVPFVFSHSAQPCWVDLVINNLDDGGHPFHLHGYEFYVLSVYGAPLDQRISYGSYNPFDTSIPPLGGPFNLLNPVKKDTVFIPRRGYAVLRFLANNSGIWMLHCHLLWHQASGMAMALHVGEDEVSICQTEGCGRERDFARQLCPG